MFRFANPIFLILLAILPAMLWHYWRGNRRTAGKLRYSDIGLLRRLGTTTRQRLRHLLFVMRVLAVTALVLALARPRRIC